MLKNKIAMGVAMAALTISAAASAGAPVRPADNSAKVGGKVTAIGKRQGAAVRQANRQVGETGTIIIAGLGGVLAGVGLNQLIDNEDSPTSP